MKNNKLSDGEIDALIAIIRISLKGMKIKRGVLSTSSFEKLLTVMEDDSTIIVTNEDMKKTIEWYMKTIKAVTKEVLNG